MTPFERTCEAMHQLTKAHPEIDRQHRVFIRNAMQDALDLQRRDLLAAFEKTLEQAREEP